jgi:hypothetical protein
VRLSKEKRIKCSLRRNRSEKSMKLIAKRAKL